jgi:O-antigen/teichoic acid export membrane protein
MSILTGDATGAPVTVLQIQAATLLAVFVNVCYGTTLIALHRHRELLRVSVSTLVFTLVAAAILVPLAGARGGAVAATAGEFVLLLAYAVTLRRVRPGLHPSPRVLLRVALAVAVATALTRLVHVPVVPNVGAFAIAGLSYLAMLMLVRAIPEELISALLRRDGRVAR